MKNKKITKLIILTLLTGLTILLLLESIDNILLWIYFSVLAWVVTTAVIMFYKRKKQNKKIDDIVKIFRILSWLTISVVVLFFIAAAFFNIDSYLYFEGKDEIGGTLATKMKFALTYSWFVFKVIVNDLKNLIDTTLYIVYLPYLVIISIFAWLIKKIPTNI